MTGWMVPRKVDAKPEHTCEPPSGRFGDRWVCICRKVYEVGWLKGHDEGGRPVYGKEHSHLYINVFDQGYAWRQIHGWKARKARNAVGFGPGISPATPPPAS